MISLSIWNFFVATVLLPSIVAALFIMASAGLILWSVFDYNRRQDREAQRIVEADDGSPL
mgnify:CR=1 FL=1